MKHRRFSPSGLASSDDLNSPFSPFFTQEAWILKRTMTFVARPPPCLNTTMYTSRDQLQSQSALIQLSPVQAEDNPALAKLIIETLLEFGCSGPGYACNDPETQQMFETYANTGSQQKSRYWVLKQAETLLGGGGYAPLKGGGSDTCELQKLYFSPRLRGLGWGKKLMAHILEQAAQDGYRQMYLETIPEMTQAISLYERMGFTYIANALGDTGHHRCDVFMVKQL
ncbi:MAG: GNAT family N-acetyltransferase [Cyanobacteria bacterium]|nr:GNAT family N-acetyltransferase [Cyanobacteriota bacterium]